jgi:hypothetical protein
MTAPEARSTRRPRGRWHRTSAESAELERIVRTYVRALKNAEISPEQALKRVKDVVGAPTLTTLPGRARQAPEQLADDLVAWFVAEYYRAD